MKIYGLLGFPLSHSFSKKYFSDKFKKEGITGVSYQNFPLESIDQLPGLLQSHPDIKGLNVTIPYKEKIIPFLNELEESALDIGAVNTIRVAHPDLSSRYLTGYNTDIYGFTSSLLPLLDPTFKNALILGTGGASKAVYHGLKQLNIEPAFVTRKHKKQLSAPQFTYNELTREIIQHHLLIVNTTPLGMFPRIETCPAIPYEFLTENHLLYDLVYNPSETLFLKKGFAHNTRIINGSEMLRLQAEKAWEIWNDAG